ncbi:MAG: hypothetical protein Q8M98_03125 [Candidatus Cloacimonadaceae bacterium]|nr:hypothetical protein [Candidatus Cloacimonadaceae bacterium]
MQKLLFLILLATFFCANANARLSHVELGDLSIELAARMDLREPMFLEVRAGEWSSALETNIRRILLEKGADVRESGANIHLPALTSTTDRPEEQQSIDLKPFYLSSASLVQVQMELQWQTVERKNFLSYRNERKPLYVFNIRQISLPSFRLQKISTYSIRPKFSPESEYSVSGIKWFEPMLATAALASIIYLLWTTE